MRYRVIRATAMRQVTIRASEELVQEIDRHRAENAAETGEVKSRSEWLRDAAREKLDINFGDEPNEPPAESNEGAA